MTETTTTKPTQFSIGGFWGSHVDWISKVPEQRSDGRYMRCWGHHSPRPRIGDILASRMQSGKVGRWVFTEVDYESDPNDMFFAWVRFVDYEDPTVSQSTPRRIPDPLLTTQDLRI
jgi:hypothetical protein